MDAPPIQYAQADDGVNLAYWTLGVRSNPALVVVPWGIGHLSAEWDIPEFQVLYQRLAQRLFLVTYDPRGSGLSQRSVGGLGIRRFAMDIGVVADRLQLQTYAIWATGMSASPAVRHAIERPEAVTHLILWTPFRWRVYHALVPVSDLPGLRAGDWPKYCRMVAGAWSNFASPEIVERIAHVLEQGTTSDEMAALATGTGAVDPTDETDSWLPAVRAKTLAYGVKGLTYSPPEEAQAFAAAIPDARFAWGSADVGYAQLSDPEVFAGAVEALILEDSSTIGSTQGFRTVLFTDLESSTALTQSLGDARAQEILRGHNDAVRAALAAHGGEEVKHTGDGIMGAFGSAVSAVEAALQIQRDLSDAEVRVRVGLNAGEPIHEDDDYFGSAVQLAARVCDRAEPGQVVVTQVVRDLVRGKGFQFDDLGAVTLKGFPEPERLFVVEERS